MMKTHPYLIGALSLMPNKIEVIRFEYRDLEAGFFVKFEIPSTQRNWNWVTTHPNTAMIRRVRKNQK